jgi:predicted amidohydrolase
MPMRVPDEPRPAAASLVYGPDGERIGRYDKIHLFDVDVPGGGESHRESAGMVPGRNVVVADTPVGRIGVAVCYDLRFPELFRILAIRGARVITLPAAFTKVTGRAHWEILVRARAIENQAFVVAADQIGTHPPDKESFGGSMIVDPWGEVLARAPDEECFIAANLDFARQDEVRDKLPSLANRMAGAYRWPDEVTA